MNRREFISLLGGAAWPLAARAEQSASKASRIGIVPIWNPLRLALRNLCYIGGQSIACSTPRTT